MKLIEEIAKELAKTHIVKKVEYSDYDIYPFFEMEPKEFLRYVGEHSGKLFTYMGSPLLDPDKLTIITIFSPKDRVYASIKLNVSIEEFEELIKKYRESESEQG